MAHGSAPTSAKISALMVTQAARLEQAQVAMADFAGQTHPDRALVVVHDGGAATDRALRACAGGLRIDAHVLHAEPGLSLGALRNRAVDAADAEWVCQWDDDDRHHPQRLSLQWACLREQAADACFLVDQLHWLVNAGCVYWTDWDREPYPFNVVQGTVLARRAVLPRYPDLRRGEDTVLLQSLLRDGVRIARLRDVGWCYLYRFHGGNAWDAAHHEAIIRAKTVPTSRLLQCAGRLAQRLAEYRPPLPVLRFPHAAGTLTLPQAS